jgi:hypothetical protein
MSKKKMCPRWDCGKSFFLNRELCAIAGNYCPTNTNSKCEIVPKKPKMVKLGKDWKELGHYIKQLRDGFFQNTSGHWACDKILEEYNKVAEKHLKGKP